MLTTHFTPLIRFQANLISLRLETTDSHAKNNFYDEDFCRQNTQAKTMAERRDERPAKIVGPNYEETTIAQKPSVAEGNEERNGLTEQQNSENQTVKE